MHICNLPDDVLRGIFQHFCYYQKASINTWKTQLLLLSICQKWRHLAISIVYNRVYLTCRDQLEDNSIDDNNPVETIDFAEIITNLDLFITNDCAHLACYADIQIAYVFNAFDGLGRAINYMKDFPMSWHKIKTLYLSSFNGASFELHAFDEQYNEVQVNQLVRGFYDLMPNLLKIKLEGAGSNRHLFGKLAGRYQNQLDQLNSSVHIVLPENYCFAQLSKLDISLDFENNYKLSQICTTSLVYLGLHNVPINYQWASFKNTTDAKCIVFSHLKTFNLSYALDLLQIDRTDTELDHDGSSLEIYFPALVRLRVKSYKKNCKFFDYAILPNTMDSFNVLGTMETIQVLSNMRIPQVRELSLNVVFTVDNMCQTTVKSINKILNNSPKSKINKLIIAGIIYEIDFGVIEWSQLTLLHIGAQVKMDIALGVIAKLPNLNDLMFQTFAAQNIPEEAFALENTSDCHDKLETLNSSITKLKLIFDSFVYPENLIIASIKYLSVRLSSLKLFNAQIAINKDMTEFVNEYSSIYPNLTNITFELNKPSGFVYMF
ncbi:hypothetical protein COEREDRAFT_86679 [Coemansia reversa NRRL 1564]|uniref:F-box domain-containing protein n=1 Tax=Coemansia reversa (strain ATCC 12441 / NRRL 1564) TaxID=763665 RepID=A0A2G5BD36_COERN|nr:hypothetical protein COEREDRAFT_86679 [Coemansia reversa NRRL 1564]|eukprot:PIA16926.1 hypothetical protein COEREDRAFT_86679 [Coemansia reversa NRRL 1564]